MRDVAILPDGTLLDYVHNPGSCSPPCTLHAPSDHHMRDWPLVWRNDRKMFERVCEHGVGHPDPDQVSYWMRWGREALAVHGCDGCCASEEVSDEP